MRYSWGLLLALPLSSIAVACVSNNETGVGGADASFDLDSGTADSSLPVDSSLPATDSGAPQDSGSASQDSAMPMDSAVPEHDANVDTGAPDAADASDAAPQVITVVVGGLTGAETGVPVVWGDSSGSVVDSTTTLDGVAVTALPGVTTVTVVMGTPENPYLYTATGVSPGQTVLVADVSSAKETSNAIVVPGVPTAPVLDDGGALEYTASSGACNTTGDAPPFDINLTEYNQPCVGVADVAGSYVALAPVLVEAEDGNGDPVGWSSVDQSFTMTDDAGLIAATVPSPWSTTFAAQTLEVPADDDAGMNSPYSMDYGEVVGSVLTPLVQHGIEMQGVTAGIYYAHPGFSPTVQADAYFSVESDGTYSGPIVVQSMAAPTTSGTVLLDPTGATAAPLFASLTTSVATARPMATWTLTSGSIGDETGVMAILAWRGELPDSGANQSGTWTIVGPGGSSVTSLTAAALPASLSSYAPAAGSNPEPSTLMGFQGTGVGGYQGLLDVGSLYQLFSGCEPPAAIPPLPIRGTAILSYFNNQNGC